MNYNNDEALVGAVQRNDREEMRVGLDVSRTGELLVDLRIYEDALGPAKVRCPTRRGLSMPAAKIDEIITALQAAQRVARRLEQST